MSLFQRVEAARYLAKPQDQTSSASRLSPREEMLRDLRVELDIEILGSMNQLLKFTDPRDVRRRLSEIVEVFLLDHGYLVTRDERSRPRRGDDPRHHGLRTRSSPSSRTRR